MKKRMVIIDGNSLINRAYYAMQRPMITRDGIYTQGIFGFLNMLTKIQSTYPPDAIAVAWDRKAPTFRHEAYTEYKAGRRKMPPELAMELPLMKEILTAMHIVNLELDGYEADDIIGTVARLAEEAGYAPLIITGDRDALQLATEDTHVLITRKGISEFEYYDREKMLERYQLTPEQFIDLKGLMGDASDNIPGIPGVGEKTGIKLLLQFGSVENLLAHTEEITNAKLREKVEANAQLAAMSRKLATICRYVPLEIDLEACRVQEPDYQALIDLYVKLEFNSFLKKLHVEEQQELPQMWEETAVTQTRIDTAAEMGALAQALQSGETVFLKVFSNHDHVHRPVLYGAAFLIADQYFYVNLQDTGLIAPLIDALDRTAGAYAGHDLIKDYYALQCCGLTHMETEFDTAVAQYLLDPSRSQYQLKSLAFEHLHCEIEEEDAFLESHGQTDLLGDSAQAYADYGLLWCRCAAQVMRFQQKLLEERDLQQVFRQVELPLVEVLASMEVEGFSVDRATLEQFGETLRAEIAQLEQAIYDSCGVEFNIQSPRQLGEVLFEKLQLPAGKKTRRGYSTSADVLEKIRGAHPAVEMVLQYRTLTKLNSTYVEGLAPLIAADGKIHAHFQQTVTATGRISCTEPNLQNIPIRQPLGRQLRRAFVPGGADCTLVGADYSQIELRILAHLSGDQNLLDAFNRGDDIHRNTAARVFNLDYDQVTSLDRSRAKAVNFGVIYGMSGFGLSEELHITRREAEQYINDYFEKHQAVRQYMDAQVRQCRETGYTTTLLGRRRYIYEISASNFMTRQLGERLAMNSPIQGSAADLIKIAMVQVFRELREKGYRSRLILQVHDELIIRTEREELEDVKALLVRNMEHAMPLAVKLECDLNQGDTWYDLK